MPRAVPLFQKVQPDGSVLFEFEGKIKARGLELTAGWAAGDTDPDQVIWVAQSNGGFVASVTVFQDTFGPDRNILTQLVDGPGGFNDASIVTEVGDGTGGSLNQIRLVLNHPTLGADNVVLVQSSSLAGGVVKSDFTQNRDVGAGQHQTQFGWDGTNIQVWVDNIHVKTF